MRGRTLSQLRRMVARPLMSAPVFTGGIANETGRNGETERDTDGGRQVDEKVRRDALSLDPRVSRTSRGA
jgi:hypothetical protein